MAFKNKQGDTPKEKKKPTTLAEYKAQGWEVSPMVGMSNPPVYTLTKDGETIKFRPKMKIQPSIKPPKRKPSKEAKPMKKGGSASFPDLSGDGKITKKDILIGRGVVKKKRGGPVDSPKKKKKKKKYDRGNFFKDAKRAGVDFTGFQDGGEINGLKKMGMKKGGLAGRLAQRGYGKARK